MPTSQKQREANRRNAQRSTGPRTTHGKSHSAANATKHGATAVIYRPIRHENPADHHAVRAGLIETWNPQTPQEFQLIEIAASAYIRLQRVECFETALFSASMEAAQKRHQLPVTPTQEDDLGCALAFMDANQERAFQQMDRYRRTANSDYHRSIAALRRLQRDREEAPVREYRAFKAHQEYIKATTAAPMIPANQPITPAPSTEMASFRPEESLHLIRPANGAQNEPPPIHRTENGQPAIE